MPNKLERSLERCSVDMVRKSIRALVASGFPIDEVDQILNELEGWLAWTEHPSPDLFEGPEGWYRTFLTFVIEGDAGKTCPSRILRRQSWRQPERLTSINRRPGRNVRGPRALEHKLKI